jgi:hypothetical protein
MKELAAAADGPRKLPAPKADEPNALLMYGLFAANPAEYFAIS